MRLVFKELLWLPSLWTRSYWVSTAGNVSQAVIRKYIEEQTHAKN
jgi:putative transposase